MEISKKCPGILGTKICMFPKLNAGRPPVFDHIGSVTHFYAFRWTPFIKWKFAHNIRLDSATDTVKNSNLLLLTQFLRWGNNEIDVARLATGSWQYDWIRLATTASQEPPINNQKSRLSVAEVSAFVCNISHSVSRWGVPFPFGQKSQTHIGERNKPKQNKQPSYELARNLKTTDDINQVDTTHCLDAATLVCLLRSISGGLYAGNSIFHLGQI